MIAANLVDIDTLAGMLEDIVHDHLSISQEYDGDRVSVVPTFITDRIGALARSIKQQAQDATRLIEQEPVELEAQL